MDFSKSIEFIPQKLYYVPLSSTPPQLIGYHFFTIDHTLLYHNFYLDFGPLNLGHCYQFCQLLEQKLKDPVLSEQQLYFYSSMDGRFRANAVCLLASWGMLYKKMTPEEAFSKFKDYRFPPFHDATPSICSYSLTILDCLKGLARAVDKKYWSIEDFNWKEYTHLEKVENGDLTWLSKKFIAFAGPHDVRSNGSGYLTLTPQDYVSYFKKSNVTLVIRLNEKRYDETIFKKNGIDHLELYYPDGGNPPPLILETFLEACHKTPGVVAVHCKAGLGRTGTCIGCYMMMHDQFTAAEVIGWLRLCRPGSVIGPQQQFMEMQQDNMWKIKERSIAEKSTLHPLTIVPMVPSSNTSTKFYLKQQMLRQKSQGDGLNEKKRNSQVC